MGFDCKRLLAWGVRLVWQAIAALPARRWLSSLMCFVPALAAAEPLPDAIGRVLAAPPVISLPHGTTDDVVVVRDFYTARGNAPIWVSADGTMPGARTLSAALAHAGDDGLDPDDYGAAAITALGGATRDDYLAELEVRLSLALVRFASDLGAGRLNPQQVDKELFVYPVDVDGAAVLRQAAEAGDFEGFLAGLRPRHAQYDRLRRALAHWQDVAAATADVVVPGGKALRGGDRNDRVPALRARLRQLGELASAPLPGDADLFDPALDLAVRRFQARHGLEQDGIVGRETLAALNVTMSDRARQIMVNMERWRWMPDDLGRRHILVNLAAYTLQLVDDATPTFETRVVVGALYHRTPVFSERMRYLEINPYWNVPDSIARKELLPKIKRDPAYLSSENLTVLQGWGDDAQPVDPATVDWSVLSRSRFPYRLRQEPGPDNALGKVKFMLPNRFNVYLHDTPAKGLFAKTRRNFSHGCIRVEAPEILAAHLLVGQGDWTQTRLDTTFASSAQVKIPLTIPFPVHITYLTAWVDADGGMQFRDDVYGRDARLAEALFGPRARVD